MVKKDLHYYLGIFARLWCGHWRYKGNRYIPTDRDRAEVKRFLCGQVEDIPTDELVARMKVYLSVEFWRTWNHPAWGFFRHFNTWIKPNERKESYAKLAERDPVEINCSYCGQRHLDNYICEALRR